MSIEDQAKEACDKINSIPAFNSNFSIIGLSQGTLISRYVIEKCQMKGQVKRFISISGPQMGIGSFPRQYCTILCGIVNFFLDKLVTFSFVTKDHVAPIAYFRTHGSRIKQDSPSSTNNFIAELNNDVKIKNEEYKNRMLRLEKLVLIMNEDDQIVNPPSSAWFEFYDRWGMWVIPLRKSRFYLDDYIGLRKLDEQGKINFVKLPGRHLYVTDKQIDTFIVPALK